MRSNLHLACVLGQDVDVSRDHDWLDRVVNCVAAGRREEKRRLMAQEIMRLNFRVARVPGRDADVVWHHVWTLNGWACFECHSLVKTIHGQGQ